MLFVGMTDKRDPNHPEVPTLKELDCPDIQPNTHLILAPKGLPDAVASKLEGVFKKVSEGQDFQRLVLKQIKLNLNFRTRAQTNEDMQSQLEFFKEYHKKTGTKKAF